MIEILEQASVDDLSGLRRAYLASHAAPFDGMWEAFATMSRQREIEPEDLYQRRARTSHRGHCP